MTGRLVIAGVLVSAALCAAPGMGATVGGPSSLDRVAHDLFAARLDRAGNDLVVLGRAEMRGVLAAPFPDSHLERTPFLRSGSGRSTRKAFFLSLLLPGLGQRYLGQERRSNLYLGAEAAIWITVAGFRLQGSLREDRYREYAEIIGGADPDVDDDDYYRDLALYGSSDVHSLVIRWEARALFPDDRNAQADYYRKNVYPADMTWSWPDKESFDEYKRLRRRSRRAYQTSVNVIGVAVLNRLVSAIDTVTGKEREELAGGMEPRFSVRTLPGDLSPSPFILLTRSF